MLKKDLREADFMLPLPAKKVVLKCTAAAREPGVHMMLPEMEQIPGPEVAE